MTFNLYKTWMIIVAIKKYQISKVGKGTVKVSGIKITNSIIDVIPIIDKGLELDLIIALHIAWLRAEKRINIKIKFIDKIICK